uniref:Transposase n=1 Tax=Acrobeloides nanus TaxID=290746 RepID=A0A914CW00_9BILA
MSHEFLRTPTTEEEWRNVALEFVSNCYLPHCLGALDGKHMRIILHWMKRINEGFIQWQTNRDGAVL